MNDVTQEDLNKDPNNIPIGVEQICAALIDSMGSIEIPVDSLLKDYSNKSIAVNHDDETNSITLTLVDNDQAESE
jgi:hypothetical protein